jgi:hypothetical protein
MLFQDLDALNRGLAIGVVVPHGAPVRLADGETKLLVSHGRPPLTVVGRASSERCH